MSVRALVLAVALGATWVHGAGTAGEVRLGYFANLTHAQALIGVSRGDFAKAIGPTALRTRVFNAGPSVIEAFMAGELDCAFIGPSPAINGYVRSKGTLLRVVAGAAQNGVVIVARAGSGISSLQGIAGRRIATPQFGNTQDISARIFVTETLKTAIGEKAGQTRIIPMANAEQVDAMRRGDIDVSWVPEPWGARMVHQARATIIADESSLWPAEAFATTVFVVRTKFMERSPKEVDSLVSVLVQITEWMRANRAQAMTQVNAQLLAIGGKALEQRVLEQAWSRVLFDADPQTASLAEFADRAFRAGMLKAKPDISGLVDLHSLERVRALGGRR